MPTMKNEEDVKFLAAIKAESHHEKAMTLLFETYKLYAAFCAILIAGLLSFASSRQNIKDVQLLFSTMGVLSFCSIMCIGGLQYFIGKTYAGKPNIYSRGAIIIMTSIIISAFAGLMMLLVFFYGETHAIAAGKFPHSA